MDICLFSVRVTSWHVTECLTVLGECVSLSLGSAAYLSLLPDISVIFSLSCQLKIRVVIPLEHDYLICFRYHAYIHALISVDNEGLQLIQHH